MFTSSLFVFDAALHQTDRVLLEAVIRSRGAREKRSCSPSAPNVPSDLPLADVNAANASVCDFTTSRAA